MKTKFDIVGLLEEAKVQRYWLDGAGVYMAVKQSGGIAIQAPTILAAVEEIAAYRKQEPLHLMLNCLPAGLIVTKHRDFLEPTKTQSRYPTLERWHLPIKTNDKCWWWDEKYGKIPMLEGLWYGPMPYWLLHQVGNEGLEERIHLVVDLDTSFPIGKYDD